MIARIWDAESGKELRKVEGHADREVTSLRGHTDAVFSAAYSRDSKRSAIISSSRDDEIAYIDEKTGSEFIEFLRERLILLRELMSDSGSIYLHIDYKIGHYVKVMMDEVFGIKNFQRSGYGNYKDMILFYTKSDNFIWNEPLIERSDEEIDRLSANTAPGYIPTKQKPLPKPSNSFVWQSKKSNTTTP